MKNIGLLFINKDDNSMGLLHDKPNFMHALQIFIDNDRINFLILVVHPHIINSVEKMTYRITEKPLELVRGDDNYMMGMVNAMRYMAVFASYMCKVMICDANRPHITNDILEHSMDILEQYDAGVCVSGADGLDTLTMDHMDGVTLQPPHSFRYEILAELFENFNPKTDTIFTNTIYMLWQKCPFVDVGVVNP